MHVVVTTKRNGIDENYHLGSICVVDKKNTVVLEYGDIQQYLYQRSTAKLFQILPLLYDGLDEKFGLTTEEIAIMMSSHTGDANHIAIIKKLLEKAGLKESDFCIKPVYPPAFDTLRHMIKEDIQPSPIYHMCSGKHIGLMLVEREHSKEYTKYYATDSFCTNASRKFLAHMAEFDADKVTLGKDGCGVSVYALPLYHSAIAFKNLVNYEALEDEKLQACCKKIIHCVNSHPELIRGKGYFCTYHNYDKNVVGKDGAMGFYGFGLQKEKLGIALKVFSGEMGMFPYIVHKVYEKIGYPTAELAKHFRHDFANDNKDTIGEHVASF